jgi:hypothetical protein
MRFYIIKQAISLLLVSSAVALRGGNDRNSQLVPDADLTGVIDIGILSATAAAADIDQYEVDGQKDHVLTAGHIPSLEMTEGTRCYHARGNPDCVICYEASTYKPSYFGNCSGSKSTEDVETHANAYTPSLDTTEGDNCVALSPVCKICYILGDYYLVGDCGQSTEAEVM